MDPRDTAFELSFGDGILGSSPSFRPPSTFVQASLARQARIKQMQEDRSTMASSDSDKSTHSSPPIAQRHGRRPIHGESITAAVAVPSSSSPAFRRGRGHTIDKSDMGTDGDDDDDDLSEDENDNEDDDDADLDGFDDDGDDDVGNDTGDLDSDAEVSVSAADSDASHRLRRHGKTTTTATAMTKTRTKHMPIAPSSSPSSRSRSTSKAVIEIEKLRQRRLERRQRADEVRKSREGLNDKEQRILEYRNIIDKFRLEFARRRAALKVRLAQEDGTVSSKTAHASTTSVTKPQSRTLHLPRIQVCVRKRPIRTHELNQHNFDIITAATEQFPYAHIYIHEPKVKVDLTRGISTHRFIFDSVFDENASNLQVHEKTTHGLVRNFFQGGRATLFAYGQTGSGKTHTIFGSRDTPGIYEFACRDVFSQMTTPSNSQRQLTLHVYFIEIYAGRIYDLFSGRQRVQLLEDAKGNATLSGHCEMQVDTFEDMMQLVRVGTDLRTTGSTEANSQSSRSHAVIQMQLRLPNGGVFGKFALVDLAGSERGADRGNVSRQARIEGAEINRSLLALKECIRALHRSGTGSNPGGVSGNISGGNKQDVSTTHIPFRASKLTLILRDSFIGRRSRTIMIAMVNPGSNSAEHSLNTLRYADRVKEFRRGKEPAAGSVAGLSSSGSPGPSAVAVDGVRTHAESLIGGLDGTDPSSELLSPTESQVDSPEFDDIILSESEDGDDENDGDQGEDLGQIEDASSNADRVRLHFDKVDVNVQTKNSSGSVKNNGSNLDYDSPTDAATDGLSIEGSQITNTVDVDHTRSGFGGSPGKTFALESPESAKSRQPISKPPDRSESPSQTKPPEDTRKQSRLMSLLTSKFKRSHNSGNNTTRDHAVANTRKQGYAGPVSALDALSSHSPRDNSDVDYPSSYNSSPRAQPETLETVETPPEVSAKPARSPTVFTSTASRVDLEEEEGALVTQHLACVATSNFLARQERALLTAVSKETHNIDEYIDGLEALVAKRMEIWSGLAASVADLRARLKTAGQ